MIAPAFLLEVPAGSTRSGSISRRTSRTLSWIPGAARSRSSRTDRPLLGRRRVRDGYADLWSDEAGEDVATVGAALQALHFWDDGEMVYDIGIVGEGGLMVYAATTGTESQVQTSEARPCQKRLLTALAKASDSPKARIALLTALVDPTPHSAFPALSRPGKSNRAK